MKRKKKRKKKEGKKRASFRQGMTPGGVCLSCIAGVWIYIGLLWLVLKYSIGHDITSVERASFRLLVVIGLGIGFTAVACLGFLLHRLRRGGRPAA